MQLLAIYGVAIIASFVVREVFRALIDPLRSVPGPSLARWTRLWEFFETRKGHFEKTNIELHQRYGSIVRIAPSTYSISDPDTIRQIYGAGSLFTKAPFYSAFGNPDKPRSDLFSELDNGRHAMKRRNVSSLYSMSALVNYESAIDRVTEQLCQSLNKFCSTGDAFDFMSWMQFYAFDVIGTITVGEPFGFLQAGSDWNGILCAVHESMVYGSLVGIVPELHPILSKITQTLQIQIPFDSVSDYIMENIKTRKIAPQSSRDKPGTDFLSLLLTRQSEGKVDDTDVFNSLGANIAAGSDTTAISLIDTAMRGKAKGEPINYNQAQQMVYMQACIKEALRLHPATGYPLLRVVPKGGVSLAGQFFPEGTRIGMNPWVLHRNEDIFGPDPASFRPERWLGAKDGVSVMSNHLLTFGAGARTCIGKNISLLEMSKLIPQIMRRFDIQLEDPECDWTTSTAWFVKQEFRCVVKERGDIQ
ncbi:cytochrome P450 [Aspergillus granulosus]|uniref:Cytochrome P450 n=1 Tax=Aspergillus granulosus TaxID=176169 RepID=A0ABR4HJU0_9EURO